MKLCSKCHKEIEIKSKRYCRKCSAAYQREWRKTHPLTSEARFKMNVRSKTHMRIRRGALIRQPCEICGNKIVEAHHSDYSKPYEVNWLCHIHHREKHIQLKKECNSTMFHVNHSI